MSREALASNLLRALGLAQPLASPREVASRKSPRALRVPVGHDRQAWRLRLLAGLEHDQELAAVLLTSLVCIPSAISAPNSSRGRSAVSSGEKVSETAIIAGPGVFCTDFW